MKMAAQRRGRLVRAVVLAGLMASAPLPWVDPERRQH